MTESCLPCLKMHSICISTGKHSLTYTHTHIRTHAHKTNTHTHSHTHTIWMSHVSHMNESCLTYEWVMSHTVSISQRQSAARHYSRGIGQTLQTPTPRTLDELAWGSPSYVRHDSFICETWLIHTRDMVHSYVKALCVRHDSFVCQIWFFHCLHAWDVTRWYVRHDSFIREAWLIHTWDMTHSYVRHDAFIWESFMCETWLIHVWDMTHSHALPSCVRHDSFICETGRIQFIKQDSFICETWLIRCEWDINTVQYQRYSMPETFVCEAWLLRTWPPLD